jgi:GT2 family glycosyltransferase
MNQALAVASGELFLLLSADDWLEPNSLEVMSNAMTDEIDIVWGNLHVVNEDGSSKGYVRPRDTWQGRLAKKYTEGGYVYDDILKVNNFVSGGMTLMRASALRKHGGWDEKSTTEDLDLWLRIGKESKFKYLNSTIGNYRVIKNSKSRQDEQKLLDHSYIFGKHTTGNWTQDKGLAYLATMRWALAVSRHLSIPKTSLKQMAQIMGTSKWLLRKELPRAITNPLMRSLASYLKRILFR